MFRFLSPLLPSKSNSKSANFETYAKGIINLPYARTLDGCLYSRNLDPKITIEESVAPVSSELKIERPPLFEKQNSQKCSRLPVQRSSKESSNSNVAAWSSTYVTSGIPLAVTRRRSWRVHCVRPDLVDGATKTHSLDSPELSRSGHICIDEVHAHSFSGETWLVDVLSEEVPKKKRSLKKKHSTTF